MIGRAFVFLCLLTGFAKAETLAFPSNASLQMDVRNPLDSYALPTGIWNGTEVPTKTVEGQLIQQAWMIDAATLTTLQLLQPLRAQLRDAGFQILLDCQTEACGGFDFRFGTATLPPPEMQINIGDFRFLAAERTTGPEPEYVSLFVSRTSQAGFVQFTHVGATPDAEPLTSISAPPIRTSQTGIQTGLAASLDENGYAVLDDLAFGTGSAQLAPTRFNSLERLADYLSANPALTVALVGHTDSSGALAGNIALSKQRAGSVLERLVNDYGIRRNRLEAEGMGYLAPIATNRTEQGREANRRVEVIITSIQ